MAAPQNPTSITHQPLLIPAASNSSSLKPITLFWCTISAVASYASIASLITMQCFNSLTHPYAYPIIILASLLSSILHLALFFNLNRVPTLDNINLRRLTIALDTVGNIIRFGSIWYPSEDSVEVVVFFVSLAVDVMAITKLIKPRVDGHVLRHTLFSGCVRVSRMCFSPGGGSFWYLYVVLFGTMMVSFNYSEVLRKKKMGEGRN